jgi:hypothetical protein
MLAELVVESSVLHPGLLVPTLLLASSIFSAFWFTVITWSYMPMSATFQQSAVTFISLQHVEQRVAAVCCVFKFNSVSWISHPVMFQPPCMLGHCACRITYQWSDDIPLGLHNDGFSFIWVVVCKIFVGNSCLNLNLTSNISDIYCFHFHGIIPWCWKQNIFRTLDLNVKWCA